MAGDPYQPCPCGSGNKLKFCCADVAAEMDKVERLLANNQPRMAIQSLEKLAETHGDSQWVQTSLASTLINEDQADRAKQILAKLLKKHPQQPYANALYAMASFNEDGYPESKRAIQRACKLSTAAFPDMVSVLMAAVARAQLDAGHVLAARQGLVLAMRLAADERRPLLFQQLVELDGEVSIPYPLRSVHQPVELHGIDASGDTIRNANRLAAVGCWGEAAAALTTLTEQHPDHAGLWYNISLKRAWDGDDEAVPAFRRSASCESAFDLAVERELLAQILELSDPRDGIPIRIRKFDVESVSRLLGRLDEFSQLARLDDEPAASRDENQPVARYLVLNRVLEKSEDLASWNSEIVPRIIGRITIFDRDPQGDQPAQVFLSALEGDELDNALQLVRSAAGELATLVVDPDRTGQDDEVVDRIPRDQMPLRWAAYVPPDAPGKVTRSITEEWWRRVVDSLWTDSPLQSLGGKSPREAAQEPSLRVPLAAALLAMEAEADARRYLLPIEQLRSQLRLDPPAVLEVTEQTNVNSLTLVQLLRVRLADLSHEQFQQVVRRATVVRQHHLLYDVLQEALNRPSEISDAISHSRLLGSLSSLCAASLRHDEALEWCAKGRKLAEAQPHAFEQVLEWKMRELTLRVEDPEDPELRSLLEDLWFNYGAKLPQLREYLVELVGVAGVTPPWDSTIIATDGTTATWSPNVGVTPDSESKLWLPGDR